MKTCNQQVTSREYKLILNSDRFQDFEAGESDFWHLVEFLVKKNDGEIVLRQKEIKRRKTWYLDTTDFALRKRGWITRVRQEKDKFKLTVKVRSPDRYISSGVDLSAADERGDVEQKFEEDILPQFSSKFANSVSIKLKQKPKVRNIKQLAELFPGVTELNLDSKTPLSIVNGFRAHESTHWLAQARFQNGHTVKASISSWFPTKDRSGTPLITEFSFDYDLDETGQANPKQNPEKLEKFNRVTASAAKRIFLSLQKQNGWVRFHATTKTAFAYDSF